MKMTPGQRKGESGTCETMMVNGVRVNKEDAAVNKEDAVVVVDEANKDAADTVVRRRSR